MKKKELQITIYFINNGVILTVSNKDEVIAASVTPPDRMFARTGAPNPIEES